MSVLIYVFHRLRPEPDDFAKTMIKCIDLYSDRGIQIDHLNSDIHNQFIWNLSAIPKSQNNAKNRATAKIKSPYFLHTVAMYDGTYRFCFGYSHRTREYGTGRVRYFRCNDIDDLTRFVKEVMALKEPTAFFKKKWVQEHLPIELYKANRKARPDSHRIGKACQMATHMLSKDKFEFELWAADSTIETALAD